MRRGSSNFYDPKFRANRERWHMETLLSDWYGREFAEQESTAYSEAPRPIGEVLDALLAKKLTPEARLALSIRERWDELIGPPGNRFARFCRLEGECAIVEITHPAFLREWNRPSVIADWCARINAVFPEARLREIRFVPNAGQP